VFSYGFYLPTALLVFILCLVYSVLPRGFLVLFLGMLYFSLGYFTYKYQLLYAMDQPQHATGGAWRLIAYRVLLGLVVFHLTMSGYLGANKALVQATLVVPLLLFTVWYSYYFRQKFEPLTRFIALQSIKGSGNGGGALPGGDDADGAERTRRLLRRGSTIDEDRERGLRFVNPSLMIPLEPPWIYNDPPLLVPEADESEHGASVGSGERRAGPPGTPGNGGVPRSTASSFSLGDTHVWRDGNGESNV